MVTLPTAFVSLLAQAGGHEDQPSLVEADVQMILWTWIVFGLLLVVLWKFAWGPIVKKLNERADKITADHDAAKDLRKRAEAAMSEYQEKLDQVRLEMDALRKKGQEEGEEIRHQLERKGQATAAELKERAHREMELAVEKARADLRRETIGLALQIAEKVTKKSLTSEDHRKFAEEAMAEIEKLGRN